MIEPLFTYLDLILLVSKFLTIIVQLGKWWNLILTQVLKTCLFFCYQGNFETWIIANSSLMCTLGAVSMNIWTNLWSGFYLACCIRKNIAMSFFFDLLCWKCSTNRSCSYIHKDTDFGLSSVNHQKPSFCNIPVNNFHMSAPSWAYNISLLLNSIRGSTWSLAALLYFVSSGCFNSWRGRHYYFIQER